MNQHITHNDENMYKGMCVFVLLPHSGITMCIHLWWHAVLWACCSSQRHSPDVALEACVHADIIGLMMGAPLACTQANLAVHQLRYFLPPHLKSMICGSGRWTA